MTSGAKFGFYIPLKVPLVIASDGRLDEADDGSVAVLVYDPVDKSKQAVVSLVQQELREFWNKEVGDKYIAYVEQAAILLGIAELTEKLIGGDIVWLEVGGVSPFVKPPTGKSFRFVRACERASEREISDSIVQLGLL